ncbi:MAG: VCBS repeat-containing protein, partial [Cyclobacteriaceae bacterium]|nr:VCBS repeat-containing protein [Cyclobacteriaceae bacterium]
MVTSALWTDVDNDLSLDIILVGEWMPVTMLINSNGRFIDKTADYSLANSTGWWNSINGADLDNDGDMDYVLGNYGLNSFY